ncbi:hypothetical protein M1545_03010 [Patescibacteria group bacterium]|nr:hypothetical protein [Patescibacteria group bacterium]
MGESTEKGKIPPPPPNFEKEQIIQEDLTKETREVVDAKRKKARDGLQLVKDFDPSKRVFPGKPHRQYNPQFKPHEVSPVKMKDDWERATSDKGRPPIGGAQDD